LINSIGPEEKSALLVACAEGPLITPLLVAVTDCATIDELALMLGTLNVLVLGLKERFAFVLQP
jgi:hypothetical protein